jgi:hypothetical protein
LATSEDQLAVLTAPYEGFVQPRPHLYRLSTQGPLSRERLPADVDARAAAPLVQVVSNQKMARAVWAFVQGV